MPSSSTSGAPPTHNEKNFEEALGRDDLATLKAILQAGEVKAYGELRTGRGYLQYAVLRRSKKAVALLLETGASGNHKDGIGSTANELAAESDEPELRALLPGASESLTSAAKKAPSERLSSPPIPTVVQLERLAALRDRGALTQQGFQSARERILRT